MIVIEGGHFSFDKVKFKRLAIRFVQIFFTVAMSGIVVAFSIIAVKPFNILPLIILGAWLLEVCVHALVAFRTPKKFWNVQSLLAKIVLSLSFVFTFAVSSLGAGNVVVAVHRNHSSSFEIWEAGPSLITIVPLKDTASIYWLTSDQTIRVDGYTRDKVRVEGTIGVSEEFKNISDVARAHARFHTETDVRTAVASIVRDKFGAYVASKDVSEIFTEAAEGQYAWQNSLKDFSPEIQRLTRVIGIAVTLNSIHLLWPAKPLEL